MNLRENTMAILHYQPYDRLPLIHFGYWGETIEKWVKEGHISPELGKNVWDGSPNEITISKTLGFDYGWTHAFAADNGLRPSFEHKLVRENPDGSTVWQNASGGFEYHTPGAGSIPAEVDHTLKDRETFEEHYRHRLQYTEERIDFAALEAYKNAGPQETPSGLFIGSLYGNIRNWLGVEGTAYLYADDEDAFADIINTNAELLYRLAERILASGAQFDFAHYWEDICFKTGPLVSPAVFEEFVAPHYKRINDLLHRHGIDIISLDCDGMIDSLIPIWLENGVNTMFPIEVGTWNANIAPWRETYGKELRGVGGMNKTVFAQDYAAVDREIERLKGLVDLGGYIPCPDHRIAPDAIWENVQYYCEQMRKTFGG